MRNFEARHADTLSSAQEILAAVRHMHQRNRTVQSAYGLAIGATEAAVLQEATSLPSGVTAKQLALRLCLTPVKISRLLKGMMEQEWICRERLDGNVLIRLLPKGQELFDSAYRRAQATFESAFERLDPQHRDAFCANLRRLNDGLRAPPASSLPVDPPLMAEVRRLTRVLGFLGRDTFGSSRAPIEWHSLSLIESLGERASCVLLAQHLGITHATMSTTLNRLQQQGLLLREVASQDSRARRLLLTDAGSEELRRIEACGSALIQTALYQFNPNELSSLVEGCKQYAGLGHSSREIVLSPPFKLRPLEGTELDAARAFVFETRVAQRLLQALPESVLDSKNTVFGLFARSELCAVLEFRLEPRKAHLALVLALAVERSESKFQTALVEALERAIDFTKSGIIAGQDSVPEGSQTLTIVKDDLQISPIYRPLVSKVALRWEAQTAKGGVVRS